jgi:predicted nucleic acid-binding Zn ribbon protein
MRCRPRALRTTIRRAPRARASDDARRATYLKSCGRIASYARRFAQRVGCRPDEVEDVVAQSLAIAWEFLPRWDESRYPEFVNYAIGILRHKLVDYTKYIRLYNDCNLDFSIDSDQYHKGMYELWPDFDLAGIEAGLMAGGRVLSGKMYRPEQRDATIFCRVFGICGYVKESQYKIGQDEKIEHRNLMLICRRIVRLFGTPRQCVICGNDFPMLSEKVVTCGPECRRRLDVQLRFRERNKRGPARRFEESACIVCSRTFTKVNRNQKYCGPKCKKRKEKRRK